MAAFVWLYCYIHCGPSWQEPLPTFLICGAHLDVTPSPVSTGTRGGGGRLAANTAANAGSNGGCVCLFVPTTKGHARPSPWKCSRVPDPTIRTSRVYCAYLLFKQRLPIRTSLALWERDKETAKNERKESAKLAKMWFPLAEGVSPQPAGPCTRVPAESRTFLNQHTALSLLRTDFPKPSFISFLLVKPLSCPPAEHTKILNSTVQNQIQSLTVWLMTLSDKYNENNHTKSSVYPELY